MFGGRAWAGSQGGDAFCWDDPWAASQASQPAALGQIRPWQGPGMPLEPPPPRSGMAALSARQAAAEAGGSADPFSFHEAPAARPPPPAPAATGWRNRADDFVLGDAQRAGLQRGGPLQQGRPLNPLAARRQAPPPASAPCKLAFAPVLPGSDAPCTAPRAAPAAAVAAPGGARPPATGGAAVSPATTAAPPPPPACSLTLERYLEFVLLLGKGSGRVQRLSELERGMLRATDLKQVLLVNGCAMGSRTKREVLDRMPPMPLFSPLCILTPADGGAADPITSAARQAPAEPGDGLLDGGALAALQTLGWLDAAAVPLSGDACRGGSCCALPDVRVQAQIGNGGRPTALAACSPSDGLPEPPVHGFQHPRSPLAGGAAAAAAALCVSPSPPADSQATEASLGTAACCNQAVQSSPDAAQQGMSAGSEGAAGAEQLEASERHSAPEPPAWLAEGVARVGQRSQGSQEAAAAGQLLGRRVCFVLLEPFDQDDPAGITDSLDAGVHEGQVVEVVGVHHDEDCPPGCTQRHAFHYVRVRADRSTAPAARRAGRRLDLVVDLRGELRQPGLEGLLGLREADLQEAWVLLEPRREEEEGGGRALQPRAAGPTPPTGRGAAAQQQQAGEWRTKRGSQPAAAPAAPQSKRQHTATAHAPQQRL